MTARVLRSVAFDDSSDSIIIEFTTPSEDIRANGVCLNHTMLIPATSEFAESLLEVAMACQRALDGGLTAFAAAEHLGVTDEDGPSPYDHPQDGGDT